MVILGFGWSNILWCFISRWFFFSAVKTTIVYSFIDTLKLNNISGHSRPHVFKIKKDVTGKAKIFWKKWSTDKVRLNEKIMIMSLCNPPPLDKTITISMKLCTKTVYYLRMCMKKNNLCPSHFCWKMWTLPSFSFRKWGKPCKRISS